MQSATTKSIDIDVVTHPSLSKYLTDACILHRCIDVCSELCHNGCSSPLTLCGFFPSFPQLENIGNFVRAITEFGLRPDDIFEANDLFENVNHTQVQSTLIALAGMVRAGTHTQTHTHTHAHTHLEL